MMNKMLGRTAIVAGTCLALGVASSRTAHGQATSQKGAAVTMHAKGTFDVKMTPQPGDEQSGGASITRYTFEKQFHGDIEGTSKGQMLGAGNPAKGSAGYVAMETVTGTIAGRSGSFVLQHNGTMDAGGLQLKVVVSPGSGTGDFAGISGTMSIEITGGKHFYDFAYTLP